MGEGCERLTVRGGPWPDSNVGDGEMITYEVSGGILCKCLVHGAIEAACFVDVALQGVWIVAESGHCVMKPWSVNAFSPSIAVAQLEPTLKVVCLALHRAEAAHLPKELSMSLSVMPFFK